MSREEVVAPEAKRWLAVVLSLAAPGLGHVYAGRPLRALVIVVPAQALALLARPVATAVPPRAVWIALVAAPVVLVVFGVLVAIDAARVASRPRGRFQTRRATVLACAGFALLSPTLGAGGAWALQRWRANLSLDLEPFRVPAGSMFPTLLIGDHFFVDVHAFSRREPQRGEVVVVEVAQQGPRIYPADLYPELSLEVYEQRIDSRAWRILDDPAVDFPDFAPETVPEDRYYVLGDNRDHSKDSRFWGTLAWEDLVGPATQIYWSWDFNGMWTELVREWPGLLARKTRWDRIGLTVE